MTRILEIASRPLQMRLAVLLVLAALAATPLSASLDAARAIDVARERLDRVRTLAAQPPVIPPLVAADGDRLLVAFRSRLDTLAAERAVVIDVTTIDTDPTQPGLPRLHGQLRGTAAGLHGLLDALDRGTPRLAVEEADLAIERPADAEIGRPTILRLAITARGVIAAAHAGRVP